MKKIKIGNLEVLIAETIADISAKRYIGLKAYIVMDETGLTIPKLTDAFSKFIQAFDRDSKAGMFTAIYDYIKGLEKIRDQEDNQQMMFALLTYMDEEEADPSKEAYKKTDTTFLKEKLEKLYDAGLTHKMVQEEVMVFLAGLIQL